MLKDLDATGCISLTHTTFNLATNVYNYGYIPCQSSLDVQLIAKLKKNPIELCGFDLQFQG